MCVTSTARRRSLTLQVLPSHLLTTSSTAATSKTTAADLAAVSSAAEPETRATRQAAKAKKSKKKSSPASHTLPHHDGLVVQHHYHDHAADPTIDPSLVKHKAKGGVIMPFPVKLHDMLDQIEADGLAHVVSWQPHGRCFVVHKPKEFVNHVMPHYFKQTKMASFQRQLNLYGFNRLTGGLDKGGYYHEMFLRGKVSLAYDIHRMRVKGTGVRLPTNPENEPNFYALPPVTKEMVQMTTTTVPISSSVMPPLPELPESMTQRRADLLRESNDHSRKIVNAQQQQRESDLVFFEGLPFHYLDPIALPTQQQQQPPPLPIDQKRPRFARRTSTVVSESESSESEEQTFLPNFSPSNFEWDGPLSCPSLQAHMRRSSFQSFAKDSSLLDTSRPLEEDIETFFQGLDMPIDLYHEQIEQMNDNDDTAFGYLLEQAITE